MLSSANMLVYSRPCERGITVLRRTCWCPTVGQAVRMPEEAFVTIETLLPTGEGRFLELWAPQGASRTGWVQVAAGQSES